MMAVVIIPVGVVSCFFAPQIFLAWIARSDVAIITSFRLLMLGMTAAGMVWLPATLQQANGWTRLHVSMMVGAVVIGAPVMLWAIHTFGIIGGTIRFGCCTASRI